MYIKLTALSSHLLPNDSLDGRQCRVEPTLISSTIAPWLHLLS